MFEAFARYQDLAPRLMMPAFFWPAVVAPLVASAPQPPGGAEIRALLVQLIQPRFDAYQRSLAAGGSDGVEAGEDILATLLRVRDPHTGKGFSFDELVDQVAMLFLAGHETSASALSWSLHLLANAPDVQERLHAEAVDGLPALADDPGRVKDLDLARNVFRETLRLFPPVGFLARQSTQACTLRDKAVPAGASVVVSPWLIQRHRALWARPDEFDPIGSPSRRKMRAAQRCQHATRSVTPTCPLAWGRGCALAPRSRCRKPR